MKQGVVVVVYREGRMLLIRRAAHLIAGGAWCFVGGGIHAGETQETAVCREFHEEVGGVVRPRARIWQYTRPDGGLLLHWWSADLIGDGLAANPQEVAEMRWCTLREAEALDPLLESNRTFLRLVRAGIVELGLGVTT